MYFFMDTIRVDYMIVASYIVWFNFSVDDIFSLLSHSQVFRHNIHNLIVLTFIHSLFYVTLPVPSG